MGFFTYEYEVASVIPPAKMFKAMVLDGDNLLPKIVPKAIVSSEIIEGDGGPGSIRKITFEDGAQFNYVKHKIEVLDTENFVYKYNVTEGHALGDKFEAISYETKLVPSHEGGSICTTTSKYHTIGDFKISEESFKAGKEKALGLFRAIEAHLLANPYEYN